MENATPKEIKVGSAVSHPLEELDSRNSAFNSAAAPGQGEAVEDGVVVTHDGLVDASDKPERIHNELSGQADVSIQAGHVYGGIHINSPGGRRRRSDNGAVEVEWSGNEPVTNFARRNWAYELLMIGFALILVGLGMFNPAAHGVDLRNKRLIGFGLGAVVYIAFWCQAKLFSIRVQKRMSPWSLCVRPRSIVASSVTTTHELRRDAIAEVMVGPIKADPDLRRQRRVAVRLSRSACPVRARHVTPCR